MSTISLRRDHELIEKSKFKDLGKSRKHYELLAENLTNDVSQQGK